MAGKHLSLGIQDFEDFIKHGFIYVDKTKFVYNLISSPKAFYFLSRPRRFGKSLLVSTLKYLFEGRKELFKGLWISENIKWQWDTFPVLVIDFNQINLDNEVQLKKSILIYLKQVAENHGISIDIESLPNLFSTIICSLEQKYKKPVVILVDEYDKPIINHLGKGEKAIEIAGKNRDVLKQLFGVLKGQNVSRALRFVFFTGVSKFSQVSIFSDLNNLNDISMQDEYSTLLGYTQQELEYVFKNHIDLLYKKININRNKCLNLLKMWYNGYKFSEEGERVYNPFSILNVFHTKKFKNYWFETGTPTFLVNLIKENSYPVINIESLHVAEQSFTTYDIDQLKIESLLFQTGYITIIKFDGVLFRLSYPNQEVKQSFIKFLYQKCVTIPDSNTRDAYLLLPEYLINNKYENFISSINAILSSIPYAHIANQDESYYHTVFYLILSASGVEVITEVLTSQGRIDIAVFLEKTIYIIELKCNQSAEKAINQIKNKKYSEKYKNVGKEIKLMGINFDTKKREITDWKID